MKVILEDFYYMDHYFDRFEVLLFPTDVYDPNIVDYVTHEIELELFDYLRKENAKDD